MTANASDETLRELAASLVRIETENPPGNEAPCAEFVAEWFADRGIDAELLRRPFEDRPQVGVRVGEGEPTIVLNGHIDVVPAGELDEWSRDPYAADVEGDTLYGRGSADMKTGVAVGMLATAALGEEIERGALDGSVVFHAAVGEETGEPGTRELLERGYDGDYGVVLEPTGLRTATSEKGLAWYEIEVSGEPSHASQPDQGSNAIRHANRVLDAIESYDRELRDREDELVGSAYATPTRLRAGTKENVVPESASITVDRRFLPEENVSEIDGEIDRLLAGLTAEHGFLADWERTRTMESAAIDVDSPFAEVFRRRSEEIAGVPPEPWGIDASTDVRFLVNDAGMEAINWGPGSLSEAHTFDERIDLEEAEDGLRILLEAAREILSEDPPV